MTAIVNRTKGKGIHDALEPSQLLSKSLPSTPLTSSFERLLLMGIVGLVPLESNLPKLGPISTLFILFGLLFGYLVFMRPGVFFRTAKCPVFIAGYIFVGVALMMEIFHGSLDIKHMIRVLFMILGAVGVASICRDRRALISCIYASIFACAILALILFLTTFGVLSAAKATDFQDASSIRLQAASKSALASNLNAQALTLAQGTVVALVLTLFARAPLKRNVLLALTFFCGVATFLPMSRSGIAILILAGMVTFYAYGAFFKPKVFILVLFLVLASLAVIPDVVFTRFTFTAEKEASGVYKDSRTTLYLAVIQNFPEYFLTGVGRSNFYEQWGLRHGFSTRINATRVGGTHNSFVEITVFWGLPALLAFLALVWQAYRCLPKHYRNDPLRLCILGIAVSALGSSLVSHNIEGKEFSLVLGMLAGSNLRIWRAQPHHQEISSKSVDF